jgi:dephospho-CoA kinase
MKVLGLTGNIASGKSLVASMFEELGARVIDVDDIARMIVEPNQPTWNEIVGEFGDAILNPDKTVNRKKLGDIIFNDKEKREILNNITHPRIIAIVRDKVEQYRNQNVELTIIEAALIVEKGGLKDLIEKLIVVTSDTSSQVERIADRDGFSREEAMSRINSQMPPEEKVRFADYVIDNSGSRYETNVQVQKIWEELTGA